MIIGLCGLIGAGKSTVANALKDKNFVELSFGGALKDGVAAMFDWDRKMLEGDTIESREWRDAPDSFLSKALGYSISPREVLQRVGTQAMRNGFVDDIWIILVAHRINKNPKANYVIPDVRFSNEKSLIKSLGGELWQVRRGMLPVWWHDAIQTNNGQINLMSKYRVHESEWKWIDSDSKFDQILLNDGTIDGLKNKAYSCLRR